MEDRTFEGRKGTPWTIREWLTVYYFTRAAVCFIWVGAAVITGFAIPFATAVLIIFYPAWDAAANFLDSYRRGSVQQYVVQLTSACVSLVATIGIAVALSGSMNNMLMTFGFWSGIAGLLSLALALIRQKTVRAQWAMILSGIQSVVAGAWLALQARSPGAHGINDLVPCVAFSAFCFLISAIWLVATPVRVRQD